MKNQYSEILSDAGWVLHKIEPEFSHAYAVHRATGQIVYIEFYDEDDGDDDRTWEAVEALITKKFKFDNHYQAMEY